MKVLKTGHFCPTGIDLRDCPRQMCLEAGFGDSCANIREERVGLEEHTLLRGPMGEAHIQCIYVQCERVGVLRTIDDS